MPTKISDMSTLTGSSTNNNSFLTIVDETISNNANKNKKVRVSSHNQFYSNNFTTVNQSSYKNYFGTGVDGDVTLSSSAQISSSFNNVLDGDFIVKNYKNLTVNSGVTLLPLKRCRGLIIYCTGDLTVNGNISMTAKGGGVGNKSAPFAKTTETNFLAIDGTMYFNNFSSSARGIPSHWNFATSGSAWWPFYKIKVTLSGSVLGGQSPSSNGITGVFCGGGGGSGGSGFSVVGGKNGGRGTIFSGGGGGGGLGRAPAPTNGTDGFFETGGNGGDTQNGSTSHGGGGGAGSPPGALGPSPIGGNIATAGQEGVGGLLICIVKGNISNTGIISSNGSNGGYGSGGGGGSGGGVINLIYGGTYTNTGTVAANGGTGGAAAGGSPGGNGGAGAITIRKVHA